MTVAAEPVSALAADTHSSYDDILLLPLQAPVVILVTGTALQPRNEGLHRPSALHLTEPSDTTCQPYIVYSRFQIGTAAASQQ